MLSVLLAAVLLGDPALADPKPPAPRTVGSLVKPAGPRAAKPPQAKAAPAPTPYPRTPPGLEPCKSPLMPVGDLPRAAGETVRYLVDVNGLSVGTVDFKIERRGSFGGQPVTEYRSLFKLDSLVATVLPVEGRAASLVPETGFAPLAAMNRYTLDKNAFEEEQTFSQDGRAVASNRVKNGTPNADKREFLAPMHDFVSGFYMLRRLPPGASGCAIIYGNQRAYTVWMTHEGQEKVKTPVGMRDADRYGIVFASDKGKKAVPGRLWLAAGADRLPYRAELHGPQRLEAQIHLFEMGTQAAGGRR